MKLCISRKGWAVALCLSTVSSFTFLSSCSDRMDYKEYNIYDRDYIVKNFGNVGGFMTTLYNTDSANTLMCQQRSTTLLLVLLVIGIVHDASEVHSRFNVRYHDYRFLSVQ